MRVRQLPFSVSLLTLTLALLAALFTTRSAVAEDPAQWTEVSQHWYTFEIGGSRAGWVRMQVETDGSQFRTTNETSIKVGRMSDEAKVHLVSAFTETKAGKPVSVKLITEMSSQTVDTLAVFKDNGIEHTVTQGGRTTTKMLPSPEGEWLPPQAVDRFLRERHEAKAKEITFRMIDPQSGLQPLTVTSKFTEMSTFKIGDRDVPVSVWATQTDLVPMDTTEMYSSDDVLVYTSMSTGIGNIVMRLSTKEQALVPLGKDVPELIISSFIESNRGIPDALNAKQARYRLRAKEGTLPALPTTGAQRVTAEDEKSVTLLVDIDDNVAAPEGDGDDKDYLESSTLIDSDEPFIQKLAERVLRPLNKDPMLRGEALREFAYEYITKKGMATAFASAGETAKTRTGDCSEHAVFLAALMRASKMPSRVATGLVYMTERNGKGLFGWHMWTQALIDGRWVDFDATLPVRHSAGHITTSTSSFSDTSSAADMASLFLLMGNLEIEILDATSEAATPTETVPAE